MDAAVLLDQTKLFRDSFISDGIMTRMDGFGLQHNDYVMLTYVENTHLRYRYVKNHTTQLSLQM